MVLRFLPRQLKRPPQDGSLQFQTEEVPGFEQFLRGKFAQFQPQEEVEPDITPEERELLLGARVKEPEVPVVSERVTLQFPVRTPEESTRLRRYNLLHGQGLSVEEFEGLTPDEKRQISESNEIVNRVQSPTGEVRYQVTGTRRKGKEEGILFAGEKGLPKWYQQVERTAEQLTEIPVFNIGGVSITTGDINAFGLIAFGAYQGVRSLPRLFAGVKEKALQSALSTGLDKWIANRSRGIPPQRFKAAQDILYNMIAKNRTWLQQQATENMLRRMGRGVNRTQAVKQTVEETIKNFENTLLPTVTVTNTAVPGQTLSLSAIATGLRNPVSPSVQAVTGVVGKLPKEPWQMTKEEFIASPPEGVVYDSSVTGEIAGHRQKGLTKVGDAFFALDEQARMILIKHEEGHDLMVNFNRDWKDVLEPFRQNKETPLSGKSKYDNPFGVRENPEEIVADAYSALFTGEADALESPQYVNLINKVREVAKREGLTLPTPPAQVEPAPPAEVAVGEVTIPINPTDIKVGDKILDRGGELIEIEKVIPFDENFPQSQLVETTKGRRDIGGREVIQVTREVTPTPTAIEKPVAPPEAVVEEVAPAVEPAIAEVEAVAEPTNIQMPEELPTTPPPTTPEGEVLGRADNEFTGIRMADLQDAQIVADIAFRGDLARWVGNLPLMRNFNRTLNPSAVAGTSAEKYASIRAVLRDESIQKSQGVVAYHSELGTSVNVFGKLNEKTEIISGKLKGLTVGDIAQNFDKYVGRMTEAEKQWLNRANDIENAVTDYFERNDIDINLLALEEGGHFATRKVWAKVVKGELLDIRYAGPGPGRPGSKIATEKRRWFKTDADAIEAGYRILPYEQALYMKVQGAYNRVADKQAADWLLLQVPWRTTGAPEELIIAAEAATLKKRHSQLLLSALNRAVRGERVPDATINSIARSYPDQAQVLRDLIPMIQAGAPTAKTVQNLTGVAKGLVDTNKLASLRAINARARAREEALKVKFEEAMIPAPAFAGKILTGTEAKETARLVTKDFTPELNKVLEGVNQANNMVRFLILAGDASPFGIQLIFMPGAHPIVATKAMRGYIGALFDPEFLAAYKTKHKDTIDRHPNLMLPEVGTAEMTEAMAKGGWLAGNQTLLPQTETYWKNLALVVPRVLGKGAGYVLAPFARAYSGAMTVAGVEMAEMLEYMGTTPEKMAEVDQHINVFRGMTSSARIGVTPHWQQWERASVLAPMYNRGIAALLFDVGRGGIRGTQARKGLGKGVSALIAMVVLIGLAKGDTPEEMLDRLDPNSPNFFTWDVFGQRIGPGSKVRAVVKLWAQSITNPEALLQTGMDNPAFRFVRGNLAPVVSSGYDLITGRSYIGDPTRDGMLSFSKEMLAGNMLPIWVQSVLLEGGDLKGRTARGVAEFFGGRAYPEPLWNEVGRLRDKYSEMNFNVKYEELNREQIDKLRNNHPDLKDLEGKARLEGAERGDEFERWLFETREEIIKKRDDALEEAATALLTNLMSKRDYDSERKYARPYYSGGMAVLWAARETLDAYSVRQIEKWMGENQKPEDVALDKYLEYRGDLIAKADVPKDWEKIEVQTNAYLARLSSAVRTYVIANKDRWIEKLPANAKRVELMRLQGIEDETWWENYRGEPPFVPKITTPQALERPKTFQQPRGRDETLEDILKEAFGRERQPSGFKQTTGGTLEDILSGAFK